MENFAESQQLFSDSPKSLLSNSNGDAQPVLSLEERFKCPIAPKSKSIHKLVTFRKRRLEDSISTSASPEKGPLSPPPDRASSLSDIDRRSEVSSSLDSGIRRNLGDSAQENEGIPDREIGLQVDSRDHGKLFVPSEDSKSMEFYRTDMTVVVPRKDGSLSYALVQKVYEFSDSDHLNPSTSWIKVKAAPRDPATGMTLTKWIPSFLVMMLDSEEKKSPLDCALRHVKSIKEVQKQWQRFTAESTDLGHLASANKYAVNFIGSLTSLIEESCLRLASELESNYEMCFGLESENEEVEPPISTSQETANLSKFELLEKQVKLLSWKVLQLEAKFDKN